MKLIVQIPCYNEAATLPRTLADLPTQVPGFDVVEVLVIDDGSTDGTADAARHAGAHHVIALPGHQGLARAFMAGLLACLERGADVIVNTDADNQYRADALPALVKPVQEGVADIVVGARDIRTIQHFSRVKRCLQRGGSWAVRRWAGVDVRDAPSGFRAFSRDAARRLNVFGHFTYTIETLIQAGACGLRVRSVPVSVNPPTRPSRLFRSNTGYVARAAWTMLTATAVYRPGRIFTGVAVPSLLAGTALGARFLLLASQGDGRGHIQSLILCAVLLLAGLVLLCAGLIAHLQGINRRLLEEIRYWTLRQRDADPVEAEERLPAYPG